MLGHAEWEKTARFATPLSRAKNSTELIKLIDAEFIKHPLAHWAPLLDQNDMVWAPVQVRGAARRSPLARPRPCPPTPRPAAPRRRRCARSSATRR
jgi:crotonobetainyl-CoA:carnitine CoA-transferase CaiB-like acyl-CoA transferase